MPVLDLFWSMLFFFMWVAWIVIFVQVVADVFRNDALGGPGKAIWLVALLFLPFLGVLVYLIARGGFTSSPASHSTVSGNPVRVGSTTTLGL
jgi:Phospholipase_D-nuclease N-terminal